MKPNPHLEQALKLYLFLLNDAIENSIDWFEKKKLEQQKTCVEFLLDAK